MKARQDFWFRTDLSCDLSKEKLGLPNVQDGYYYQTCHCCYLDDDSECKRIRGKYYHTLYLCNEVGDLTPHPSFIELLTQITRYLAQYKFEQNLCIRRSFLQNLLKTASASTIFPPSTPPSTKKNWDTGGTQFKVFKNLAFILQLHLANIDFPEITRGHSRMGVIAF